VVQGAAKDGVGAFVERLEQRYVALPPDKHSQCAGPIIWQLQWQLAGRSGVVSSGRVFGSTQFFKGNSEESKNCPGKMSGELNTVWGGGAVVFSGCCAEAK
jgi:hypothetical protein